MGGWWELPLLSNAELRQWVEHSCGHRKARGATGKAGELGVAFPLRRSQDQASFEQIGVGKDRLVLEFRACGKLFKLPWGVRDPRKALLLTLAYGKKC